MKFNVAGKAFYEQLSAVAKVINAKNTLSILDNFLLRLSGETLYIIGSDQENEIIATIEVFDVDNDGAVAVSAKQLLEIVKEISSQPLTITVDENTFAIKIEYMSGHFDFMGVSPVEFPTKEEKADEVVAEFSVPAAEVRRALELTLYAVSTEPIRPMMTGVLWDIEPERITFVSSDTHKLVRYRNMEVKPGVTARFIMPAKPASIIKGLIDKDDTDVHIVATEKGASLSFGSYVLSCRFIKGNYPNYDRVIPTDNPFSLTADRATLLSGMRRASLFASKASSLVRLEISSSEIKITGQDLDYATLAEERVDCDYVGNPMTIGFNALYCQEVLSNMPCDTVRIELSDPARPGVFMPDEQKQDEELVTIQMPMQVVE